MSKILLRLAVLAIAAALGSASPAAAGTTEFWNLTANKIVWLVLSPTGKAAWGNDQTVNDPDHTVDSDERLKITDTPTGSYDLRFKDERGRDCTVKNLAVVAGQRFSVKELDLKDCSP